MLSPYLFLKYSAAFSKSVIVGLFITSVLSSSILTSVPLLGSSLMIPKLLPVEVFGIKVSTK
jgi:hypothetical protein